MSLYVDWFYLICDYDFDLFDYLSWFDLASCFFFFFFSTINPYKQYDRILRSSGVSRLFVQGQEKVITFFCPGPPTRDTKPWFCVASWGPGAEKSNYFFLALYEQPRDPARPQNPVILLIWINRGKKKEKKTRSEIKSTQIIKQIKIIITNQVKSIHIQRQILKIKYIKVIKH